MTIRGITFDFWDTLFSIDGGSLRRRRDELVTTELAAAGVDVGADVVESLFDDVAQFFHEAWAENRQYRFGDALSYVSTGLSLDDEVTARIEKAWLDWYRSAVVAPRADAVEAVRVLAGSGMTMAIICDVSLVPSRILEGYLRQGGIATAFVHRSWSDEVGVFKPDPAIFRDALDGMGIADPSTVAHVGDLRRTDVVGARSMGMVSVRYRGSKDDTDPEYPEANHVVDDHRNLRSVLGLGG